MYIHSCDVLGNESLRSSTLRLVRYYGSWSYFYGVSARKGRFHEKCTAAGEKGDLGQGLAPFSTRSVLDTGRVHAHCGACTPCAPQPGESVKGRRPHRPRVDRIFAEAENYLSAVSV